MDFRKLAKCQRRGDLRSYRLQTSGRGILRAGDGIRTHDNDVGNVVLYQLSYTRVAGQT
jgi:hypothetical protein